MKVIIAGGRDAVLGSQVVDRAIANAGFDVTEVVSGACRVSVKNPTARVTGADWHGEFWAERNSVPIKRFYADEYGKWPSCGPRRNRAMAEYADALIAFPGGRGTTNMIEEARKRGLEVFVATAGGSRLPFALEPLNLTQEEADELDRIRAEPSPLIGMKLKRVRSADDKAVAQRQGD